MNSKTEIRKSILKILRNQKEDVRRKKSLIIQEKLLAIPEFQHAKTVLFYASFDGEVETFEMMKRALSMGKTIALPHIIPESVTFQPVVIQNLEEDLETGPYGIFQPCWQDDRLLSSDQLDACIVPGIAFDRKNFRLGRGVGYYDRFLKNLPGRTATFGLAFDFQIVDRLPNHSHDIPVSRVITN